MDTPTRRPIAQAGIFVSGAGLMPPDDRDAPSGSTASGVQVEDGPFADSKEQLGGFFVHRRRRTSTRRSNGQGSARPRGAAEIRPVLSRQG